MPVDFPSSPSLNDIYTFSNRSWRWDGEKWVTVTTTGPQGPTGAQGNQGFQGFQGATGSQGSTGSQGETGSQGPQGFQGFQGNDGTAGSQGFQGFQGFQGATGSQGPQGFQGEAGSQGPQGFQGFQGNDGTAGSQGFQGFQGATGSQGPQGFQGEAGSGGSAAGSLSVSVDGGDSAITASSITRYLYQDYTFTQAAIVVDQSGQIEFGVNKYTGATFGGLGASTGMGTVGISGGLFITSAVAFGISSGEVLEITVTAATNVTKANFTLSE